MLLLDTHVCIWWAQRNKRLGQKAHDLIDAAEVVNFSAATVFELELKRSKIGTIPQNLASEFARLGFVEIPISATDAATISELPELAGHDPFDLLLLAQAKNRNLQFLTADRTILARNYPWVVNASI